MAGGCLLPAVRYHNPDRGKDRSERDHNGCYKMKFRRHAVPAENQYGEKSRFEEKSEDTFSRQCRAEHIAHKARVHGPVRSKLEFHDDSSRHTHRETDCV